MSLFCFLLPSAAKSLVEVYKSNLLVAYGIAQSNLCIQITTLCVQQVDISDNTVNILQLGKVKSTFRCLFQSQSGFVYIACFVEFHDCVSCILECV